MCTEGLWRELLSLLPFAQVWLLAPPQSKADRHTTHTHADTALTTYTRGKEGVPALGVEGGQRLFFFFFFSSTLLTAPRGMLVLPAIYAATTPLVGKDSPSSFYRGES